MKYSRAILLFFLLPALMLFSLVYLVPIIIVFFSSFLNWKGGMQITFAGFSNYINAINDPNMKIAIKNTFIWVVLQSTVHVLLGTLFAFILSKKPRGWKFFRTLYMIPNVISMAALGIIFLNIFSPELGLINSIISKITGTKFIHNWYFSTDTAMFTVTLSWILYAGLISILVLSGIMAVPSEIIEAAKIDGASSFQRDIFITLPMIRSILGTSVILSATSMLKEFELIYLTTSGGPGSITLNLPLYLYKTSLTANNYGYANMMGVILIALGVIIVIGINKIFKMDQSYY